MTIRVVVVDDDFMVARVNAGYVTRMDGFEVAAVAHTGADALATIADVEPQLVLLDNYLPDMTGLDVLRELRAADSHVDVLMVTAARDAETVRRAVSGGAVHYLIKPFTYAALHERLERYAAVSHGIESLGEARQEDVDRLFGMLRGGATPARMPKGLSQQTDDLVAGALRSSDADLSASEVADSTGLARVSARRYLEWLVETGQAHRKLRYGSAGRPEHRYGWGNAAAPAN